MFGIFSDHIIRALVLVRNILVYCKQYLSGLDVYCLFPVKTRNNNATFSVFFFRIFQSGKMVERKKFQILVARVRLYVYKLCATVFTSYLRSSVLFCEIRQTSVVREQKKKISV